jgi:hypothetical protein
LLDWTWGGPLEGRSYFFVELSAAAGIAACCGYAARRRWPQRRLLTLVLGLGCCWMTAMGPATEPSTYTLLAPSLSWAVLEGWLERRGRYFRGLVIASYGLLVSYHVIGWTPFKVDYRNLGPEALAGLLLAGGLIVTALRDMARAEKLPGTSSLDTAERTHNPPGQAA